jgi:hypothetical protein
MKTYQAIVWVGDENGQRVSIEAQSAQEAFEKLRHKYGEDSVIDVRDEEAESEKR